MSLAISMEVLESKSHMYLCCERKRPLVVGITSMPRKKMEVSHVFDREGVTKFVDDSSYKCGDVSCDNDVINIHKTIAENTVRGIDE
jgi:hypothetical protein